MDGHIIIPVRFRATISDLQAFRLRLYDPEIGYIFCYQITSKGNNGKAGQLTTLIDRYRRHAGTETDQGATQVLLIVAQDNISQREGWHQNTGDLDFRLFRDAIDNI